MNREEAIERKTTGLSAIESVCIAQSIYPICGRTVYQIFSWW